MCRVHYASEQCDTIGHLEQQQYCSSYGERIRYCYRDSSWHNHDHLHCYCFWLRIGIDYNSDR